MLGCLWPETTSDSLETMSAKEDKKRFDCCGNHLGCPKGAQRGLQCGLSGSRVLRGVTAQRDAERETASIGDERCITGKTNPYLSRKINSRCCPVQLLIIIEARESLERKT